MADITYIVDSFGRRHRAGSKEEVWITDAIRDANLRFYYQYSLRGGSVQRKGGYLIDWLVWYIGWTPVEFQGTYWHKNKEIQDLLKRKYLEKRFPRLVYIYGREIQVEQDAKTVINREFP